MDVHSKNAPDKVVEALRHVREHHPEVTHVVFFSEGRWLYMDSYGYIPPFSDQIDVGLLEDALDSVEELPAIFFMYKKGQLLEEMLVGEDDAVEEASWSPFQS